MVVAWCMLLPISVTIARTCKHNWPPAWFQIHRAVGVRSFSLSLRLTLPKIIGF
jgi:hypothetical protein